MQTEEQVASIIEEMANNMPGFIAAALVDLDSGITLGMYSTRDDFDLSSASAYNSEIVKQKQQVMKVLDIDGELEDMTMILTDQIHMIKIISESTFIYLAADRSLANLAIVRNGIQRQVEPLSV